MTKVSKETKERAYTLRTRDELTIGVIAERMHASKTTVSRWIKQYKEEMNDSQS